MFSQRDQLWQLLKNQMSIINHLKKFLFLTIIGFLLGCLVTTIHPNKQEEKHPEIESNTFNIKGTVDNVDRGGSAVG